jgi:hypothetical protein
MMAMVALMAATPVRALEFDFVKIADSNTPMPGGSGTFQAFGYAALDQYQVAFVGIDFSTNYEAIYISTGGVLTKIVDTDTYKPGTVNYFQTLGDPSISGGNVAFYGGGDGESGVYSTVGGLNRVADSDTAIPSGTGHFLLFGSPSLDAARDVAFWGSDNAAQQGIYSTVGGLHVVADRNTLVPGGAGSYFASFDTRLSVSGGDVAFRGSSIGRAGVYKTAGGTLQRVADTTTPMPGGSGNFFDVWGPSLHNGNVAFLGQDADTFFGIYTDIGGPGLSVVADVNTPVPGGSGNFGTFGRASLDNLAVAFDVVGSSGEQGVFTDYGGSLSAVITSSMSIDGKQPLNPHIGPEALNNGNIVFSTDFSDGSGGIYVAEQWYDYTANASGDWDTASNWSFGLKPRAIVGTVIRPENGAMITGPASATTLRRLNLGTLYGGVTELRLQPSGQLTVNEWFVIETGGRLNVGGGVVTAVYGFDNFGEIDLAGGQINGGGSFNSGVLRGSGTVGNYLLNFNRIQAIDARMQFTAEVTNFELAHIDARDALLEFNNGLTNFGRMNFSFGTSDVFGNVLNDTTGKIIVSGGAGVTFYGDITQSGTLTVSQVGSTNSVAVFLGNVYGGGASGGGDIFYEGEVHPGSSAALVSFENDVHFGAGATLEIELGGKLQGSEYDALDVTGTLSLGGTLAVSLIDPTDGADVFQPAAGDAFDILDWGSRTGTFAALELPSLGGSLRWDVSVLYTTGVLSVSPVLLGDYNEDGAVNAADYTVYRNRKSRIGGTTLPNDAGAPGVTIDDYLYWKAHYGETSGSGAATAFAYDRDPVPEPAAWIVLIAGWVTLGFFRSRGVCPLQVSSCGD